MNLDQTLEALIGREGRYSNNPNDAGGETMWGVTARVARANGYQGRMIDMPRETAKSIYRALYWIKPGFDQIAHVSARIAEELLDTGVNMGPSVAAAFLQRSLNAFNYAGLYADLVVDGNAGPATRAALAAFLGQRGLDGEKVMLRALNGLQASRYIEITEGRPQNRAFTYGWFLNRVVI